MEVFSADGALKFSETFHNDVTLAGRDKLLDATFKTGLASPSWFVALVDGAGTPESDPGDVMGSHPGWSELTKYDEATRQALVLGDVAEATVENSLSPAKFTLNDTCTIAGVFIVDNDSIGGSDGCLYDVGVLKSGDYQGVASDVVRITDRLSSKEAEN
jgi:hypothetical protein